MAGLFRLAPLVLLTAVLSGLLLATATEARADPTVPLAQRTYASQPACGPDGLRVRPSVRPQDYGSRRPREWRFSVALPIWIPGVSGDLASGDVEIFTDGDSDDVLGELFDGSLSFQFGFVGAFTAEYRKWFFAVDAFGASLGSAVTFRLTDNTIVEGSMFSIIGRAVVGREIRYQLSGGRTFTEKTDENGEVTFKLPTRDFREAQPLPLQVTLPERSLTSGKTFFLATQGFTIAASTVRPVYLAGDTFVTAAQRGGRRLVVVQMKGDGALYDHAVALLDWGFAQP